MSLMYQMAYTMMGAKWFVVIMAICFALFVVVPKAAKIEKVNTLIKLIATPVYCAGLSLFGLALLLGYYNSYDKSMKVYTLALCAMGFGICLMLFNKVKLTVKICLQMTIVSVWCLFWYISAMISDISIKEYPSFIYVGFMVVFANAVLWCAKTYIAVRTDSKSELENKSIRLSEYYGLIVLIAITVILSAIFIWKLPFLWDAADYLKDMLGTARWEFTTGTALKLDICAHRTAGYVLLTEPGIWLFENANLGIHVIQTIMLCITLYFFWEILRKEFTLLGQAERTAITAVLLFTPAMFGLSSGFNPDLGMFFFIIWFIYAWSYDLGIFKVLFGTFLCFTKEPGIMIYVGICFGIYLIYYIKSDSKKLKLFTCMKLPEWIRMAIPPVLWLVVFELITKNAELDGTNKWNGGDKLRWRGYFPERDGVMPHNFGFSPKNIANQLHHEFLMNFEWIITALIIAFVIVYFVKKKKSQVSVSAKHIIPCVTGITLFTLFYCVFVTHPHYRYLAPSATLILIILVELMSVCIKDVKIRTGIYSAIAILFCVQTFVCIDPVTVANGHKVNTGDSFVINYAYLGSDDDSYKISDYSFYNLQNNLYGGLLNKVLKDVNQEDSVILVAKDGGDMMYCALGGRAIEDGHGVYYSPEFGMFSALKMNGYNPLGFGVIDEENGVIEMDPKAEKYATDYANVYYLIPSFASEQDANAVLNTIGMSAIDEQEYSYYGGWKMKLVTVGK